MGHREIIGHAELAQDLERTRSGVMVGSFVDPPAERMHAEQPDIASDEAWARAHLPGGVAVSVEAVVGYRDPEELWLVDEDRLERHFRTPQDVADRYNLDKLPELRQLEEE